PGEGDREAEGALPNERQRTPGAHTGVIEEGLGEHRFPGRPSLRAVQQLLLEYVARWCRPLLGGRADVRRRRRPRPDGVLDRRLDDRSDLLPSQRLAPWEPRALLEHGLRRARRAPRERGRPCETRAARDPGERPPGPGRRRDPAGPTQRGHERGWEVAQRRRAVARGPGD